MSFSCQPKAETYTIETNLGNIKVKLYDKTPLHKENFEKLVSEHLYDSVMFHRIIPEFMIQSGNIATKTATVDDKPTEKKDPDYTIQAEFVPEYIHKKGALAAARIGDHVNPEKRSSSSQFYIVHGKTFTTDQLQDMEDFGGKSWTEEQKEIYKTVGGAPFLDKEYTVFGEVVEGLDIVDKIASVPTAAGDWPQVDVRIIRIVKD